MLESASCASLVGRRISESQRQSEKDDGAVGEEIWKKKLKQNEQVCLWGIWWAKISERWIDDALVDVAGWHRTGRC